MGIIIAIVVIAIVLFVVVWRVKAKKRTTCDHCGTKYSKEDVEVYDMGERKFIEKFRYADGKEEDMVKWLIIFDIVCKCPNCKTVKHKTAKLPLKVDITDEYGTYEKRPDAAYVKEQWSWY